MYKVSTNTEDVLTSTTIRPDGKFGGWMAVNTGTDVAVVDGYSLQPGDCMDYTGLRPDVVWNSQININLQSAGSKIRLTRLVYRKV